MPTYHSYPDLVRAIREEVGLRKARRMSKAQRLAYARSRGWDYDPPANYGANVQATGTTPRAKQILESQGETVTADVVAASREEGYATVKPTSKGYVETQAASPKTAEILREYTRETMQQRQKEYERRKEQAMKEQTSANIKIAQKQIRSDFPDYIESQRGLPAGDIPTGQLSGGISQLPPLPDAYAPVKISPQETMRLQTTKPYDKPQESVLLPAEKKGKVFSWLWGPNEEAWHAKNTRLSQQVSDYQKGINPENISPVKQGLRAGGVLLSSYAANLYSFSKHPFKAIASVVDVKAQVDTVKELGKKGTEGDITLISDFAAMYTIGKGIGKVVEGVAPVKEVPIRAKGMAIVESVRQTKNGLIKDVQVFVDTVKGKAKLRFPWQKSKVKVQKSVSFEANRVSRNIIDDIKVTESTSSVKGVLNLADEGKKMQVQVKDFRELSAPVESIEPSNAYTGETKLGNPLEGTSPKLEPLSEPDVTTTVRKGYEYTKEVLTPTTEFVGERVPGEPISDIVVNPDLPQNVRGRYNLYSKKIELQPGKSPFGETGLHEAGHHIDLNRGFLDNMNPKAYKEFSKFLDTKGLKKSYLERGHAPERVNTELAADLVAEYLGNRADFKRIFPEMGNVLDDITRPKGSFKTIVVKTKKNISVPEKTSTNVRMVESRVYRKSGGSGRLVAENVMEGEFVKREYTKRASAPAKPSPSTKPYMEIVVDKKGRIKVKDLREYQVTESGKTIKIGKKPVSHEWSKIVEDAGPGSRQVLETIKQTKSKAISRPIIGKTTTRTIKGTKFAGGLLKAKQMPESSIMQEGKGKTANIFKSDIGTSSSEEIFSGTRSRESSVYEMGQSPFQSLKPVVAIEQQPRQLSDPVVGLAVDAATDQVPVLTQQPVSSLRSSWSSTTKQRTGVFLPVPKLENDITDKKEDGYNVVMYEEGQKVKANDSPLPRREAERLGRDIADNSLSASYRITKTKTRVPSARRSPLATGMDPGPGKFTSGRAKRKGFFVEREKDRLDTPGEKQGITAAKLIKQRKAMAAPVFGSNKKQKGVFGRFKWR